ncbi:MAG: hypothetical protein KJ906_02285 [Nanoarchaeota archaeon]|nr:hypothetical protein [Nanoarchaeota archaeon]
MKNRRTEYFEYDLKAVLELAKELGEFRYIQLNEAGLCYITFCELMKDGYIEDLGIKVFEPVKEINYVIKSGKATKFYKLTKKGEEFSNTLEHKITVDRMEMLTVIEDGKSVASENETIEFFKRSMEDQEQNQKMHQDFVEHSNQFAEESGRKVPNEEDKKKAQKEVEKKYYGDYDSLIKK